MKFPPPPFLRRSTADRAKEFLRVLWSNLGVSFSFSPKNIIPLKFGNFYKVRTIKKTIFLNSILSISLLLSHRNDAF